MNRRRYYFDLAERVGWTFAQAFAATFTADALLDDVELDLSAKATLALMAGVYAVLKGVAAKQYGAPDSASSLPEHLDPPAKRAQ